jgi:hypothetical protein
MHKTKSDVDPISGCRHRVEVGSLVEVLEIFSLHHQ